MKTPYGKECRFFYGDYYRGRNFEECRLLTDSDKHQWEPIFCKNCPVPGILINNGCQYMVLSGKIKRSLFSKRIQVSAYCTKSHSEVKDPNVGCEICHRGIFSVSSDPKS